MRKEEKKGIFLIYLFCLIFFNFGRNNNLGNIFFLTNGTAIRCGHQKFFQFKTKIPCTFMTITFIYIDSDIDSDSTPVPIPWNNSSTVLITKERGEKGEG